MGKSEKTKILWKAIFVETLYIASIFHDIGYPWQYINLLNSKLEHANCKLLSEFHNSDQIINKFTNRLLLYPFNGYKMNDGSPPLNWRDRLSQIISSSLNKTHGLPGALGFIYLNDVLRKYPDQTISPIKQFCLDWAAMAIMMHYMCKIYWGGRSDPKNEQLKISFEVDPLSCLLTIADLLQEFKRPFVKFNNKHKEMVKMDYQFPCQYSRLRIDNDRLWLEYFYDKETSCIKKKKYLKKEVIDYFDSSKGYINLSYLGINTVKMEAYYFPL